MLLELELTMRLTMLLFQCSRGTERFWSMFLSVILALFRALRHDLGAVQSELDARVHVEMEHQELNYVYSLTTSERWVARGSKLLSRVLLILGTMRAAPCRLSRTLIFQGLKQNWPRPPLPI